MEIYKHAKKVQQFLDSYLVKGVLDYQRGNQKQIENIVQDFSTFLKSTADFEDTTTRLVIQEYEKLFDVLLPDVKELSKAVLERTYQGMLNQVPGKLNQQLADYIRLVNSAIDTGGLTRDQAVEQTQELLKKWQANGTLKYTHAIDSAGRRWRLDYLIKRDIRDAQKRSANTAAERIGQQLGGQGVYKISTVPECRDTHLPWQGQYFADLPGKYEIARVGTVLANPWALAGVGQVDGLFGINCRHVKIPVFAKQYFKINNFNPLKAADDAILKLERY